MVEIVLVEVLVDRELGDEHGKADQAGVFDAVSL